jgi:transcriptional regulator with XRE-family HTH domain
MVKPEWARTEPRELAVKIGERMKMIRTDKNITQSTLSKMLKINQSVYSKWESGKVLPTTEHLLIFSETVGLELSDFLKDIGSGKGK